MSCNFELLPHLGIQTLSPYIPGKSIEAVAREQGISQIIKLASNENPLGCSEKVKAALQELTSSSISIYPAANAHPLKYELAKHLGVEEDMLVFGNGTDGLFPLFLTCFALHRGKHLLIHDYAFISYAIHAQSIGVPFIKAPLAENWNVDVEALLKLCNENTGLIFLANPNNPTGALTTFADIKYLLSNIPECTLLVLDEAYHEYLPESFKQESLGLLKKYKNLIITRTFSKAYGLAGLRLGYSICDPSIAQIFQKVLPPFTVSQISLIAAQAALNDQEFITQTIKANHEGIKQLIEGVSHLNLSILPSHGNFITIQFEYDTQEIYQQLQKLGIIVRPLHPYGLNNYLRVSVGTKEQNELFLDKLALCLNQKG